MHTRGLAIKFIEKAFGPCIQSKGGLEVSVLCPVCNHKHGEEHKKKLAIRTDSWLTHCWVCGYKAKSVYQLLKLYHPQLVEEYVREIGGSELIESPSPAAPLSFEKEPAGNNDLITLPHGFVLLATYINQLDSAPWYVTQAVSYLYSRGLTEEDLWYYKLGVTEQQPYRNRVIIPSFNKDGELNFFTSRSWKTGVKPPYFNPPFKRETVIFNELNLSWEDELTIVEGPFDLFKCNQNATCLLGKELTKECLLFQQIALNKTPVVIALDSDATRSAAKIASLLASYSVPVKLYKLPTGYKDPGVMSKNEFIAGLNNAIVYDDWQWLKTSIEHGCNSYNGNNLTP